MNEDPTWVNSSRPPPEPPDELIGRLIDERYFIEKSLGHGGVGAVYLARDRKLHDKRVVVKVLLEESLRNEWVVQKFLQEKEALARIDHPGVVGIIDAGEIPGGNPYIVMQYIEGRSLRDAIKEAREGLELEHVASIVKQSGSALWAVHSKGIFHRDLKPENIMLQALGRGEEQVKIVDFGIAKVKASVIGPSTVTGTTTAGTLVYMSPEQLLGEKISAHSDIYSFGVIAYEMVTGGRPFRPSTVAHLIDLQREGVRVKPRDLRPHLPTAAEAVILRALAVVRTERYEDVGEFAEALASALLEEPESSGADKSEHGNLEPTLISVAPIPTPPPITKEGSPVRWPRIGTGIAIVFVLLLAAAFAGLLFTSGLTNLWGPDRPAVSSVGRERSLMYSLTVQRMRDGKPYLEPFQSSGQEIFESGYQFRFNVVSAQSGYLYVFNEGPDEQIGRTLFTILYPTPAVYQGSARLEANQPLSTNWNTFEGKGDTERFWIVWSESPVVELEAARDDGFKDHDGALTNVAIIENFKQFLIKHSENKPETTKDTIGKQTFVRTNGDLLVKLLELEHR